MEVVRAQLGSDLPELPMENETSRQPRQGQKPECAQPWQLTQQRSRIENHQNARRARADTSNQQTVRGRMATNYQEVNMTLIQKHKVLQVLGERYLLHKGAFAGMFLVDYGVL